MAEIEETLKRLQSQKGVIGLIVINSEGIPVRSTMDNATTVQYASLLHSLVANARNCVRDTDPQNDLTFLRVRSKKHEIMIAPAIGDQRWYFSQVKGSSEDEVADADVISCVEFNRDGELLATGDKGGRVVVFKREEQTKNVDKLAEYSVYATFQSHEPEFDYLKSIEIEEKINKIQWLRHSNPGHFHLLSTNDKTIKLWRVMEKHKELDNEMNLQDESGQMKDPCSITSLRVPRFHNASSTSIMYNARKVFANAHAYHINSISVNSDQETFISADDLRINLWHLDITNQSFNIIDIKPANMEELTEVITSACFHPTECNTLIYGSSKGILRLCDLRSQALCDQHIKLYHDGNDDEGSSFFTEIISSISDIKFSSNGQHVVTRDYLTVKVWDLRRETQPVETYQVHDYLRSKMCALYENDCIFDKFEANWSHNDRYLLTGSYHNFFHIFDRSTEKNLTFEASRELQGFEPGDQEIDQRPPEKRQPLGEQRTLPFQVNISADQMIPLKPKRVYINSGNTGKRKRSDIPVDSLDFSKKVLHSAWHPQESVVAVAATSSLFIFNAK